MIEKRKIDNRNEAGEHAGRGNGRKGAGIDSIMRDLASFSSASPPRDDDRRGKLDEGLLVCGACRSTLIYPADCEERDRDHWHVELWCPDCGHHKWALFDIDMLDGLDRELDRAEAEIEADLACLTRANMADYVNRFVAALDADAIEPEDFTA